VLPEIAGWAPSPRRWDRRIRAISAAHDANRPVFNPTDWLQESRDWLAHGMLDGEIDACRAWLAIAAQVPGWWPD
jgi:hypothetical protein